MFCRPLITDAHVQRALDLCKTKKANTADATRTWSRALRLIQIKSEQQRFVSEGGEIAAILETLDAAEGACVSETEAQ